MALPIDENVALSSRRCAGCRYLYEDVVKDPLAPILAGEDIIASERINKEKNAVYPVVAVRTHWMDEKIMQTIEKDPSISQVVLCGAGMDARGYRLSSLRQCEIYELDIKAVLDYKMQVIEKVSDRFPLIAKGIHRLDSDFSDNKTWMKKLQSAGFSTSAKTIWILEGFLYYFDKPRAEALLRTIYQSSPPGSLLLADHINDYTLSSLKKQAANKWLTSTFSSSMEIPEEELKRMGFTDIEVVTVGEEGANYGIWNLPVIPRQDSQEVMRTYLFQALIK